MRVEWDADLRSRVGVRSGGSVHWLTRLDAAEFLQPSKGAAIDRFALATRTQRRIDDPRHGPAEELELSGVATTGLHKTLVARIHERHPGLVLLKVRYRNGGADTLALKRWVNAAHCLGAGDGATPAFWSFSGSTYPDRRDWIEPLRKGFSQENSLAMTCSDYGGGTPMADVWHRDGGLAVGHVEPLPHVVALPVHERGGAAYLAMQGELDRNLAPGEELELPETLLAAHQGDCFVPLDAYRKLMAERGIAAPAAPPSAFEPIWCAWGYERDCTPARVEQTLPKVRDLGLSWVVLDDGWQGNIGDWRPDPAKYPRGDEDMRGLVGHIRAAGLKPRLWYSPLSVAPGSDLLHDHSDMLLRDRDGAPQAITWWNTFTLCPAYAPTVEQACELVRRFIGQWGFAGLKIDGQHLNAVAPCHNPAHRHARPEESVERLPDFYCAIYEAARAIDPQAVIEICPCGTSYSMYNLPYMNQEPASDPESSWQVRLKGKVLKALLGAGGSYAGDHVELSDGGMDFASTVGIGAVVSTKFTWPVDPKPKDSFLLTAERETEWRRWIDLYRQLMLPQGRYRGELYDIGFDRPETHAIEKSGRMVYAFYAAHHEGMLTLRGLGPGAWLVRDLLAGSDVGEVTAAHNRLHASFAGHLLLEARPAGSPA